jgi:hypothetical protein
MVEAILGEVAQESPASDKNPSEGMDVVEGRLMDDCAPTITACGKLDSIKIEYRAGSTKYIINNVTEETMTVGSTDKYVRVRSSDSADTQARNNDKDRLGSYDCHYRKQRYLNLYKALPRILLANFS